MFDIGWSEMLVIGVVALVVLGPKELPGALKTFAYWTKQARKLAREFQSGVDDMVRQAELDEAKKLVEDTKRSLNREIGNSIDPTGDLKKSVTDAQKAFRTPLSATPSTTTTAAEPASPNVAVAPAQSPLASEPATSGEPAVDPQIAAQAADDRVANG